MRTALRRSYGMVRVGVHLARGAATMAFVFPFLDAAGRRRAVVRWSRGVLDIFGLELMVEGEPHMPETGAPLLLVGNHISWVDIYAYVSVAEARFVAKSEVRSWPLIGWFARNLGTIFVERDRPRDAIRVGREIAAALEAGSIVSVFPEGTTTDGSVVLPFSSVLMHPALERGVPVQPVSITYRTPDGGLCRRTAFTGDETLVASLWKLAGGGRSVVELRFLPPLPTDAADRRRLAREAEAAIRASLGHPPREAAPVTSANAATPLPFPSQAATPAPVEPAAALASAVAAAPAAPAASA